MLKRTKISSALLVLFGGAVSVSAIAQAQAPQRIEVVGSNIKRVQTEGASPIQIITREEIERTGSTSLNEVLQNITASSSGSFSETNTNLSSGGGSAGISLRGLGLSYTLTLIDGRRVAPSGFGGATGVSTFTDVNSIPLSAIDRVEVLKGSASAIYGADAVGGVINIVLRRDFRGGEVSTSYSQTSRGDGETTRLSAGFGVGNLATQKFNFLATVDAFKREAIRSVDRPYGATANGPSLDPIGIDSRSLTGNPGSFRIGTGSTPANFAPSTPWRAMPNCPTTDLSVANPSATQDQFCLFNFLTFWDLVPPSERVGGLVKATYEFSPSLSANARFIANQNKTLFNVAPTPLPQGVIRGNAPGNSLGQDYTYFYRITAGGPRVNDQKIDFSALNFGLKGALGQFDWDAGVSKSTTKNTNNGSGYANTVKIAAESAAGNLRPYEFALNPALERDIAQKISASYTRVGEANSEAIDLKISGELLSKLGAGPLQFAAGAELRKEDIFDQCLTPECTAGPGRTSVITGANSTAAGGKRDVNSQFVEFKSSPIKGLDLTLAARRDAYEGENLPDPADPNARKAFGKYEKVVPQLAVEYRPNTSALFRGVIGEGFKAPTLFEAYQSKSESFNNGAAWRDQRRCPTVPAAGGTCLSGSLADSGSVQVRNFRGGNPELKPESSQNLSLGFVLSPSAAFSVSADLWAIHLEDTIGLPSITRLLARERLNGGDPLVTRLPASPADTALGVPGRIEYVTLTYANLGATRLKGADVEAEYRFRTKDWGRFTMRGVVSYLTSYRAQSEPGAPMFEYAGVSDLPRFRMVASLRWTNGPWDLIHSWRHTGEQYQDVQFSGEDRIKAENYHDVSVNYTGIKKLSLGLTIRNIMDRTPSFSNGESQNYSYAFGDPRGRSFQLNAKYTF